jgi:YD repeat-containing protein
MSGNVFVVNKPSAPGEHIPVVVQGTAFTTDTTRDSTGQSFSPAACTHAYGYDASGLIVTDTATDGTSTWIKTYTYNASAQLTGETQWVKQ